MRNYLKVVSILLLSFSLSFSFVYADQIMHPMCAVSKSVAAPNDQVIFTPSMPSSTEKFAYRWVGEASTTSTGAIGMAFIYPGDYSVVLLATSPGGGIYSTSCPKVKVSLDATSSAITGGFYPYPFVASTTKSMIPNEAILPPASCFNLGQNLSIGLSDNVKNKTDGIIYKLQMFLKSGGYLKADPTGYFGSMTRAAVKSFQAEKSIEATGFVGPITRANIKIVSCSPL